jgi:peptide/nickel transport system ATP-binding protein
MTALLHVNSLVKEFRSRRGLVRAVDNVSFSMDAGETLALVGESGSGKTTTALCSVLVEQPTSGTVTFDGVDMTGASKQQRRVLRRDTQFVFQDPASSLNPRLGVGDIVREPLDIHAVGDTKWREQRVRELLERVGLPLDSVARRPGEFSGGQRQRIGIARALALEPKLIVCDEPVSALDVSIQAQIINLLRELQRDLGTAYLFIGHNLAVVRHLAPRVAVMYRGTIVETGGRDALFERPGHPYTAALIAAVPTIDGATTALAKTGPSRAVPADSSRSSVPTEGCVYASHCPRVDQRCRHERPSLTLTHLTSPDHLVACHYPNEPQGAL